MFKVKNPTSYEKLSKKKKKELDREKRSSWQCDPRTKVVKPKKGKGSYFRQPKHKKDED